MSQYIGDVAPEGVVTANPGSTYVNRATGAMYMKESGYGNTGWDQINVISESGPGTAVADVADTHAQGTLTLDTNPTDTNTMTVDSKVYTFLDTLTGSDGQVQIGASLAATQASLVAAFDLSGTAGTDYGASMTAHPTVDIAAFASDDAVLTAKVGGVAGNSIATTETFTAGTNVFDAATLGTTTAGVDPTALQNRDTIDALLAELRTLEIIAT